MSDAGYPQRLALDCGPVSAVDLALYAAASGDHNPLHLDVPTARAAGFDRPIAQGMLTMAYAARVLTNAFGASGLRSFETRFSGVVRLGDAVRVEAMLNAVEAGVGRYSLTVTAADGRELATGQARVARPAT